jgi:hypothetical protein
MLAAAEHQKKFSQRRIRNPDDIGARTTSRSILPNPERDRIDEIE